MPPFAASAMIVLSAGLCLIATTLASAAQSTARTLQVGGVERAYLLSRPAATGPRPTIVVLHGGTLTAAWAQREMGVEPLVDREGLVAVYPDAIGRRWNDGRTTFEGQFRPGRGEDVDFIRALVES